MGFFDSFTKEKTQLALNRTRKNMENTWKYASKNPAEAALCIGFLVTFMAFFSLPTLLLLCVSALALLCFNLFNPASMQENFGVSF